MKDLIGAFPGQLKEALEIGRNISIEFTSKDFANVLICGLGGSGIGGTIVSELISEESKIPILTSKEYFIPNFVNEKSLVVVCSYSGNTEETISLLEEARAKKAEVVCVSSGGKLIEMAKAGNLPHIILPAGYPPRAALSYSLTVLLFVLHQAGIISNRFEGEIEKSIKLLENEKENIKSLALETSKKLKGKIPVIYSTAGYEGVAVRFRQQLNENAKLLAWHHVIPEMNHNELVGWMDQNEDLGVVFFRNDTDYSRVKSRIEINKEIISKCTSTIIELFSKGESKIEKTLFLIHMGDFISLYLAEDRGVDVTEVKVIDHLKDALSKL